MRALRMSAWILSFLFVVLPITQAKSNFAYVANFQDNTVSVINTTNNSVVTTIPVANNPFAIAVNQAGSLAAVANYGDNTVYLISTSKNTVVATIPVGSAPMGVVFSPNGKLVYVTNQQSNSVSVINTATRVVTATVSVQNAPEGIAILPNGTFVYVVNSGFNTVSVVSTLTNKVVATTSVGVNPVSAAVSPDGSTVYVTNFHSNSVSIIQTSDNAVINTITGLAAGPSGGAVSPDGHWLYVASAGTVTVIDTSTQKVVATIPTGGGQNTFLSFSQDSAFAYVTEPSAKSVAVIDTASKTVKTTIPVGNTPTGAAVTGKMKVSTVAGGYVGDKGLATSAALDGPVGIVQDKSGNYFVSDHFKHRIRKITPNGTITTVAGTGVCGYNGDGIPASKAMLCYPDGLAFDAAGNLYVADAENDRVRKIDSKGKITTIAGTGVYGYSGDGGPATSAALRAPYFILFDGAGNMYFSEILNNIVRKVDTGRTISTYAGNGTAGFGGDGGPAVSAQLNEPHGIAFDATGNLYIGDSLNYRVRIVSAGGTINTFAGTGPGGCSGDGGLALNAHIGFVRGLTANNGALYIAGCSRIRAVSLTSNIITTFVGSGQGYDGDNNPPLSTRFLNPSDVFFDASGNVLVDDSSNGRVRMLRGGVFTTFAGGFLGDGNPATSAALVYPEALSIDKADNLYIADRGGHRIRKVSAGRISTIAGTSVNGYSGDGGPATSAQLNFPQGVAVDSNGNTFISDELNFRVRKVDTLGNISTFANDPNFCDLQQMTTDSANNVYVADECTSVIFKITPAGGVTIVAGVPFNYGYNGDGIPATDAWLNSPFAVAVDSSGNLIIADTFGSRLRLVDTAGIIHTIAGDGNCNYTGDGGLATDAEMCLPWSVAVSKSGTIYFTDQYFRRVREISGGIITAFAGSESFFNGDKFWPLFTALDDPVGVALDSKGGVYVLDDIEHRVRKIK